MILNTVKTDNKETRVAVITSKVLGGAVVRNRAKRRIRASVDQLLPMITPGWDLVIIARKNVVQAESEELRNALRDLLTKAGIL